MVSLKNKNLFLSVNFGKFLTTIIIAWQIFFLPTSSYGGEKTQNSYRYFEKNIPLIVFSDKKFQEGWKINCWGGGNGTVSYKEGNLIVDFNNAKTTLSNTLLFEKLKSLWRKKKEIASFYLVCRGELKKKGSSVFTYVTKDNFGKCYKYFNRFYLDSKWRRIKIGLGGFHRSSHPFKLNEVEEIRCSLSGTGRIEIKEIGMIIRYKKLPNVKNKIHNVLIPKYIPTESSIILDGIFNEPVWKEVPFLILPESGVAKKKKFLNKSILEVGNKNMGDYTEVYPLSTEEGLYFGVRCYKYKTKFIKAEFTVNVPEIWQDECVEFYFVPFGVEKTGKIKKWAINANGCIGAGHGHISSKIKVGVKRFRDYWELEIFFPWTEITEDTSFPLSIGLNMTRTIYNRGGKLLSRGGWSTLRWNDIKNFGLLLCSRTSFPYSEFLSENICFYRNSYGKYLLVGDVGEGQYFLNISTQKDGKPIFSTKGYVPKGKRMEIPVSLSLASRKGMIILNINLCFICKKSQKISFFNATVGENSESIPSLPIDSIALFPKPKYFRIFKDRYNELRDGEKVFFRLNNPKINMQTNKSLYLKKLNVEMNRFFSLNFAEAGNPNDANVIITDSEKFLIDSLHKFTNISKSDINTLSNYLHSIKNDGYFLIVTPKKIIIGGNSSLGILYGINTFIDLVKMSSPEIGPASVRCVRVVDWPSFGMRIWFHSLPGYCPRKKYDPLFYESMLANFPMRFKYNFISIEPGDYYQWDAFGNNVPSNRIRWTRKEFKHVVKFCYEHFVKFIPSIESYGHMAWLLRHRAYCDLRENGDMHTLCIRNPQSRKVLFSIYNEFLNICSSCGEKPYYFITGFDEVRWKDTGKNYCKYCDNIPRRQLFLEQIEKIHDFLNNKNIRMIMWHDMIIEEHNGLNRFKCCKIRDKLPRDIILAFWNVIAYPGIPRVKKEGFECWKVTTGFSIDRQWENLISARGLAVCNYHWWLGISRCAKAGRFGPMAQALYSNTCWNISDSDDNSWKNDEAKYGKFLMYNWSRKPLNHCSSEFILFDISSFVNEYTVANPETGRGWFDEGVLYDLSLLKLAERQKIAGIPVKFTKGKNNVVMGVKFPPFSNKTIKIPCNSKIGSLIFLHCIDIKDMNRFRKALVKKRDPLTGLPVVKCKLISKTEDKISDFYISAGWNVSGWRIDPLDKKQILAKYLPDARFFISGKTQYVSGKNFPDDIVIYQYEWVNPYPETFIKDIVLQAEDSPASYMLLALTARKIRK